MLLGCMSRYARGHSEKFAKLRKYHDSALLSDNDTLVEGNVVETVGQELLGSIRIDEDKFWKLQAPGRMTVMKKLRAVILLLGFGPMSLAGSSEIQHVVLCWLAEDHSSEDVNAVKAGFRQFADIPQVASIVVGDPLQSERAIVDDSFHVGVIMQFNNAEDLEGFMVDVTHKHITEELLAPLCPRAVVYDIR